MTTNKVSEPYIGWKPCEAAFYLDGVKISLGEAIKHWREGTAVFGPFAADKVRLCIEFPLCASAMGWVADNQQN